jgi:hypothetical protein
MAELKEGQTYFQSGTWPSRIVSLVRDSTDGCLVRTDGSAQFVPRSDLYPTRLEADEATLKLMRFRLKNGEAAVAELRAEIEEVESKKGQP